MVLALVGYLAFALASLVVGTRLLRAGARRRALPELALGAGFLCSGGLGFLLLVIPRFAPGLAAETQEGIRMAGQVVTNAGFLGIYLFNVRVFGGGGRGAGILAAVGFGLLVVSLGGAWHGGVEVLRRPESPSYWLAFVGRTSAFVWAAASGFHHYAMQRRRLALGLADPVIVNRFLLWGLYGVCTTALMLSGLAGSLLAVEGGQRPLATSLPLSAFGIACAVCMGLAFFPPEAYLRRIRPPAAA